MSRKPWEEPVIYNEDRFDDIRSTQPNQAEDDRGERSERDISELLRRPDRKEEREYACNDTAPLNYERGPHDEEFGDDEDESHADPDPVDYGSGPDNEDDYGVDDDE